MSAPEADSDRSAELLAAALEYAAGGARVFPLFHIAAGRCSCGEDCSSPGKHPRTKHGLDEASSDPAQLRAWWGRWPGGNIGVATGAASGIVVLDVDPEHGGEESFALLEQELGPAPETARQRTGSGGTHLIFAHPGGRRIGNRARLLPGIDVRGDGGYIVVPPSNHISGGCYAWRGSWAYTAPCDWLLRVIEHCDELKRRQLEEARGGGERASGEPEERARVLPFPAGSGLVETRRRAWGQSGLDRVVGEVERAQKGARNDTLNRAAFTAGQLIAARTLERRPAEDALRAAAHVCWPGKEYSAKEVEDTIRSGITRGQQSPARVPDFTEDRPLPGKRERNQGEEEGEGDGPPTDPGQRTWIRATGRLLDEVLEEAWSAILAANEPPVLFRRDGVAIRLHDPGDGSLPRLEEVTQAWLFRRLGEVAGWHRGLGEGGQPKACFPPKELAAVMKDSPDPRLPLLDSIVGAPVFDASGHLVREPGYHPQSRLWYHRPPGLELGEIPESPTDADLYAARELLLDELLGEFPFVGPADRAHALAGVILPFVRRMIGGCTPLHLVESPMPGSGKSYLTEIANALIEGGPGQAINIRKDEDETTKILAAKLLQAPTVVRMDNLNENIDSAVLSLVLTTEGYWEPRLLGKTQLLRLPVRCTWWATSNNPRLSTEVARRTVKIRLNAKMERPQNRTFSRPDLAGWALENRGKLLSAVFVLVSGWISRGKKRGNASIVTYGEWAGAVGGILETAGVTGLLDNQEELYELADEESSVWVSFCRAWALKWGDAWVQVADLYRLADPPADDDGEHRRELFLEGVITARTERGRVTQFGTAMLKVRDRVFEGRTVCAQKSKRTKKWEYRLAETGREHIEPEQPMQQAPLPSAW